MRYTKLQDGTYNISFETELEKQRFKDFISTNNSLRAADVMKMLDITRPTLCHYVKRGLIKIDSNYTGKQYRYNRESVLALKK